MKPAIREQMARIYRAVHDGTTDVDTIDDALKNIESLLGSTEDNARGEDRKPRAKHKK